MPSKNNNLGCFTDNKVSIALNECAEYHAHYCYELNSFNTVQYILYCVRETIGIDIRKLVDINADLIMSLNLKGKYRDLQHYAKVLGIPATMPARELAFILLSIE